MDSCTAWLAWIGLMVVGVFMMPLLSSVFPVSMLPLSSSYAAGPIVFDRPIWFHKHINYAWSKGKTMLGMEDVKTLAEAGAALSAGAQNMGGTQFQGGVGTRDVPFRK